MKKSFVMFAVAMAFAQGASAAEMQFCLVDNNSGSVLNCFSSLSSCNSSITDFERKSSTRQCVAMPKK